MGTRSNPPTTDVNDKEPRIDLASVKPSIQERLESTKEMLAKSTATHIDWRDWLRRDNEPPDKHLGDADFHHERAVEYEAAMAAVSEAVTRIAELEKAERMLKSMMQTADEELAEVEGTPFTDEEVDEMARRAIKGAAEHEVKKMAARLKGAEARIAELEADGRRLDWKKIRHSIGTVLYDSHPQYWVVKKVLAVIDAAIE